MLVVSDDFMAFTKRISDDKVIGSFVYDLLDVVTHSSPLDFYLAEGVGFEPTDPFGVDGFQDRSLKPLGQPSVSDPVWSPVMRR